MGLYQARVMSHVKVNETAFLLELYCPEVAKKAEPGQFVMLKCGETKDPLLRRPFGIHKVDREKGYVFVYYGVVGVGTNLMKSAKAEDKFSLMGPIGRGFELAGKKNILIVGGGMGIAPLLFLAEELYNKDSRSIILLGAGSSEGLNIQNSFASFAEDIVLATDDGSLGYHGFVTDLIKKIITNKKINIMYACGPVEMLGQVKNIAKDAGLPCQVSLESNMACGVGVCLGCACKGRDEKYYPKVCIDGPVFWAEEVALSAQCT